MYSSFLRLNIKEKYRTKGSIRMDMAEDDEMGGSDVAVGDQAAREATSSNPRIGTTRKPGAPQAKSAPKAQPQGTETATEATTPATEQLGMCPQCYTSQE